MVAGYEVGNRVAEAMHPSHLFKGFLPTGSVGTIGAAAAAARILQLDEKGTFNALGIAGFILPIVQEIITLAVENTGTIRLNLSREERLPKAGSSRRCLQTGDQCCGFGGGYKVQKGFCRIVIDGPPKI